MKIKKSQNKAVEIELFNAIALEQGHYETSSKDLYDFFKKMITISRLKLKGQVLEAGSGSGVFGKILLKKFKNIVITGIDISPNMVKIANDGTKNYHALTGDLEEKKQFKKNSFDFILCPFILHHFPQLDLVMENLSYWLKPNGYLILIEPNGQQIIGIISKIIRIILQKIIGDNFIVKHQLATPNETDHTFNDYKKVLIKENLTIIDFQHQSFFSPKLKKLSVAGIKTIIIKMILKIFPNSIWANSIIFIIAKKVK